MKKETVIEYLVANVQLISSMARDVNNYDGSLDYLDYYENDDYFFEIFYEGKTIEAVRAVCYGNYNYSDDYVRINVYGNLDSCTEYEYFGELRNNVEEVLDNFVGLYKDGNVEVYDEEFKQMLDEYIEGEENEG